MADYELLDFGAGRRLERFGQVIVDRPCPPAELLARAQPDSWEQADVRFERTAGRPGGWIPSADPPQPWTVRLENLTFELRLAASGQVGLFPEQIEAWRWIRGRLGDLGTEVDRDHVLNLFAYTGGTTLAAAAEGAAVTHVDAAKGAIAWARRNAQLSALDGEPIRWISDDASAFVAREGRRGRRYDALVLDPPSYGHGPSGSSWRLDEQLPALLARSAALLSENPLFVVVTAHTPSFGPDRLEEALAAAIRPSIGFVGSTESGELGISDRAGRRLRSGSFARWSA